jgi:hypothetical protein
VNSNGRKSYGYLGRYLGSSGKIADYRFNNPDDEIQKVDRYWSNLPSRIEMLENKVSILEKEWLGNLPTFDQVNDKAKSYKTVPVIKNLYLWQSFEHATVALNNIIDDGKVRVSFLYDVDRIIDWKELGVIINTALFSKSDELLVGVYNLDWKDTPYDKASFEAMFQGNWFAVKKFEIYNDFVNGSTKRMTRWTDIIRFSTKGLSEILGINDETYRKLYPSLGERRKISYESFIANLFERKFSALNVNFDDNYISYRKTNQPHFGLSLKPGRRGGLVIMRTLQGHARAPKDKIVEPEKSKSEIEADLLKSLE